MKKTQDRSEAGRYQSKRPPTGPPMTPSTFRESYPGEVPDVDASPEELAQREREKTEMMATLRARADKASTPLHVDITDLVPSVARVEIDEQVTAAAEEATQAAAVITEEVRQAQADLAQAEAVMAAEIERMRQEHERQLDQLRAKESLALAEEQRAREAANIVALRERAARAQAAERAEALERARHQADRNAELKNVLAPRIAAAAQELDQIKKLDTTALAALSRTSARRDWVQRTRIRWWEEVQRAAQELMERVAHAQFHVPKQIAAAEEFMRAGWKDGYSFRAELREHQVTLGYVVGRAESIQRELALISSRAASFDHLFKLPPSGEPIEEQGSVRAELAAASARRLGAGYSGGVRLLDGEDPLPHDPRANNYADSGGLNPTVGG